MDVQLLHTNDITSSGSTNGYPAKPITEIITNGFFTVDRKWTVKYWNNAAEELLGVKATDIVGKNLWEKFAGVIPLNFYEVYHTAFLQDIPVHFEEYWGEMGAWFDVITYHCDDTLSVSFKSNRQIVQSPVPAVQLKLLNELYRFVSQVTNDCLWEWDLQAREIFWIDGGHKRVFGYPIENALIPQSFWESRIHPEDIAGVLSRLNKIIGDGSVCVWEDEYRFRKADGIYAFVHDRGQIIYDAEKKGSRMIGATQDISQKVLLENKLTAERVSKQKEITEAVLTAQENERADIGQELHDNLNQTLAAAKMYMQMAKSNEKNRDLYLEKSRGFVEDVIEEIRRIAKNLVVPGVHITGLSNNIENLLHDLAMVHPIKIEFYKNGIDEDALDEKLQLNIFRIVQEQSNNILKHSKATHATINLTSQEGKLMLLIVDNGEGCDMLKEKKGVGLINIQSRAELYNGEVTIVTKPWEGFELKVVFPLDGSTQRPAPAKVKIE